MLWIFFQPAPSDRPKISSATADPSGRYFCGKIGASFFLPDSDDDKIHSSSTIVVKGNPCDDWSFFTFWGARAIYPPDFRSMKRRESTSWLRPTMWEGYISRELDHNCYRLMERLVDYLTYCTGLNQTKLISWTARQTLGTYLNQNVRQTQFKLNHVRTMPYTMSTKAKITYMKTQYTPISQN